MPAPDRAPRGPPRPRSRPRPSGTLNRTEPAAAFCASSVTSAMPSAAQRVRTPAARPRAPARRRRATASTSRFTHGMPSGSAPVTPASRSTARSTDDGGVASGPGRRPAARPARRARAPGATSAGSRSSLPVTSVVLLLVDRRRRAARCAGTPAAPASRRPAPAAAPAGRRSSPPGVVPHRERRRRARRQHALVVAVHRAPAAAGVRGERRPHAHPVRRVVVRTSPPAPLPHGSSGVTGESEPKASATPTPCIAPIGLRRQRPRRRPSRCAYIWSGAAPQPVERRLHAGDDAELDQPRDQRLVDDLDVLDPVPAGAQPVQPDRRAAAPRSRPARCRSPRRRSRGSRPARRARRSRRRCSRDLLGGHVAVPAAVRTVAGRARAACAVREPSAPSAYRSPPAPDRAQLAGLRRAHQLAPVAVHLGQPLARTARAAPVKSSSLDVPGPPHSCTAAMPSDAAVPQRGRAAPSRALRRRDRAERDRPDRVVGVARAASPTRRSRARLDAASGRAARWSTAPSGSTPGTGRPAGRPPPGRARPPVGGAWSGPGRLVPAVPEHDRVGRQRRRERRDRVQHARRRPGRRTGPARAAPARCRWRARARRRTPA